MATQNRTTALTTAIRQSTTPRTIVMPEVFPIVPSPTPRRQPSCQPFRSRRAQDVVGPGVEPADVALVELHARLLVFRRVDRPRRLVPVEHGRMSAGSSRRRRFASSAQTGMLAGEEERRRLWRPAGSVSAYSMASIPPQEEPNRWMWWRPSASRTAADLVHEQVDGPLRGVGLQTRNSRSRAGRRRRRACRSRRRAARGSR